MPHSYAYDESTQTGTVLLDGAPQFTLDAEINPQMHGYCATPKWAAQLADGRATVDAPSRTITFAADFGEPQRAFTAKTEDQRDEVIAIRDRFAAELATGLGITAGRAQFFCGWLWRVLKVALPLLRATGRI